VAQDDPIAYRLREALRLRGRTAHSLQVRLAAQGVSGSSSASVSRYVRGSLEAPVGFLRAAARELGIFEPWLISGYGTPDPGTPSGAVPERPPPVPPATEREERVGWRLADRFHRFGELGAGGQAVIRDLCLRLANSTAPDGAADLDSADRLGAVLQAPLEMLGVGERLTEPGRERVESYAITAAQAIAWLLPDGDQGVQGGKGENGGGGGRRGGQEEGA
jgi:transcriptional regulator with XRE-family HTH domain